MNKGHDICHVESSKFPGEFIVDKPDTEINRTSNVEKKDVNSNSVSISLNLKECTVRAQSLLFQALSIF